MQTLGPSPKYIWLLIAMSFAHGLNAFWVKTYSTYVPLNLQLSLDLALIQGFLEAARLWACEQAVGAVLGEAGEADAARGHHGQSAGHGLQHRHTPRLVPRSK